MKITYTFDDQVDGDMAELRTFQQARKMYSALWEFTNNNKWRLDALEEKHAEGYQMALDRMYQLMEEYGVRLDD